MATDEEKAALKSAMEWLDPKTLIWLSIQKHNAASFWRLKMIAVPRNPAFKQKMLECEGEATWLRQLAARSERLQDEIVAAADEAVDEVLPPHTVEP